MQLSALLCTLVTTSEGGREGILSRSDWGVFSVPARVLTAHTARTDLADMN